MSYANVQKLFADRGLEDKLLQFSSSSATVEEAAATLGCEGKLIAKTLSFLNEGRPILIVVAGDARIDNKKYKQAFGTKAKMIPGDQVEELIGHAPGGVCPFAVKEGVLIYLDSSLKRFDSVYPAAGSSNSAAHLTLQELEQIAEPEGWVDVCKDWSL